MHVDAFARREPLSFFYFHFEQQRDPQNPEIENAAYRFVDQYDADFLGFSGKHVDESFLEVHALQAEKKTPMRRLVSSSGCRTRYARLWPRLCHGISGHM